MFSAHVFRYQKFGSAEDPALTKPDWVLPAVVLDSWSQCFGIGIFVRKRATHRLGMSSFISHRNARVRAPLSNKPFIAAYSVIASYY
jgi:hypothetical protein